MYEIFIFQACKNFMDENKCVPHCPLAEIYDPDSFGFRPNPDVKYTYGPLCVPRCPRKLLLVKSFLCQLTLPV